MDFLRRLIFSRPSTNSINEEKKVQSRSESEIRSIKSSRTSEPDETGVKRNITKIVEEDEDVEDPDSDLNLHKKGRSSRELSENLSFNTSSASSTSTTVIIDGKALTRSPRSRGSVIKLAFQGTTDLGEPVYRVWYIEFDELALGCTDLRTYSDICTSYSHLKAICDSLKVLKVGSLYKCRGNASKAKEGQGATVFHSIHPTLLNDHYHDTSRYCAPFSYFNVRKPPIETRQKIMEKLEYAEECSLAMLANAVFEADTYCLQKVKIHSRTVEIGVILSLLPSGIYLLADRGHVVSVDIKEKRIDSTLYDSASHRPKEFSKRAFNAAGIVCVDEIRKVVPKLNTRRIK